MATDTGHLRDGPGQTLTSTPPTEAPTQGLAPSRAEWLQSEQPRFTFWLCHLLAVSPDK